LFLFLATACSRDQSLITLDLPGGTRLTFLEGERAARALTHDRSESYFTAITLTDLAIQLKKPMAEFASREQALVEYQEALRGEVRSFTLDEITYLESVFQRVNRLIYRFSPRVLPRRIGLIKVNGYSLGQTAQFTRDDNIVLGTEMLTPAAEGELTDALIRAIFHIYSREYAPQRQQLYEFMGYYPLPVSINEIAMPADFRDKLLLQPDAQAQHYVTSIAGIDAPYLLPLNTSVFHHFSIEATSAIHKTCGVYVVDQTPAGKYILRVNPDGSSTLSNAELRQAIRQMDSNDKPSFIHPEFALAWLFSSAVRSKEDADDAFAEAPETSDTTYKQLQIILKKIARTNG